MPTAASVAANCALASLIFESSATAFCLGGDQIGLRLPDRGLRGVKFLLRNGVLLPQFLHRAENPPCASSSVASAASASAFAWSARGLGGGHFLAHQFSPGQHHLVIGFLRLARRPAFARRSSRNSPGQSPRAVRSSGPFRCRARARRKPGRQSRGAMETTCAAMNASSVDSCVNAKLR